MNLKSSITLLAAVVFFSIGCAQELEFDTACNHSSKDPGKEDDPQEDVYTPTEADLRVDQTLFKIVNLNYSKLSSVRKLYDQKRYCEASEALLAYFKSRKNIKNPLITIPVTYVTPTEKACADAALPEGDYRFAVHSGLFYESKSGSTYIYPSFSDGKGGINWEFNSPGAGNEFYQKHWHAWFTNLACAYSNTGDEKYFDAWKSQYSDWLEKYPCPSSGKSYSNSKYTDYGYKSWHALSMATRISSQVNLFDYFISSDSFDFEWLTTFLKAFSEAVTYSSANLYYEPSSNIRFAQYEAHAVAAIHFPELANSSAWLDNAAKQIGESFSTSFNEDGVQNELDMGYHLTVVENYRKVYEVAKANDKLSRFPADYVQRLQKAVRFFFDYLYPDYRWECFNETKQTTSSVAMRNAATYSAMFPGDMELKYIASGRAEGTAPEKSLISYPISGYYMFHSDWTTQNSLMLVYKNNYNPAAKWHSHLDNGNVGLYANGRIFLPASGSYTYGDGDDDGLDKEREEFKATANHNTVTKGLETIGDKYSKGVLLKESSSADIDMVIAQNQSYSDLTHRRTVWMLDKSFFVVADAAFGSCSGSTVNVSWHLCRDTARGTAVAVCESIDGAYGAHTEFDDGNNVIFRTFSESTQGYTTESGISWYSEKIGEKYDRKFYRVGVTKQAGAAVRFITVILPVSAAVPSADIKAVYTDGGFSESGESLTVTIGDKQYKLSYKL